MKKIHRRLFMASAITSALAPAFARASEPSDAFPSKVIKIIVPLQAGGAADVGARIVGANWQVRSKQPVIVENKAGGSFVIGMQSIIQAPPDGYTLITLNSGMAAAQATQKRYDMLKSLSPITKVGITPVLFTVHSGSRFKSLKELVDYAKKHPGQLNYGSVGIGSMEHLWVTLFSQAAGIEVTHVPFKGMPDTMTALMRGELSFVPAVYSQAQPFIEKGMLRSFGVISDKRLAHMPGLPTVKEQGFDVPPFEFWSGYAAPAGTPAKIVAKLNSEILAVLQQPDTKERYLKQGTVVESSTPGEFGALIASELAWMDATAKAHNIKLE